MPGWTSFSWGSRGGAFVLVLCLPAMISCGGDEAAPLAERTGSPPATVKGTDQALKDQLAAAPAELAAFVRDRYRLAPDRRLLEAVAMVRSSRGAAGDIEAKVRNGRWQILADGQEIGLLSEFPDFEEATELLVRQSQVEAVPAAAAEAAAKVDQAIGRMDPAALAAALASPGLDRRSAAAGLAWLATLSVDFLEQGDSLPAAAWASLAGGGDPRNEVLVARALGYEAAAIRLSGGLAADDPVKLYAVGDESGLAALCAGRPEERPCHFLRLALLAERDQAERLKAAALASPFRDPADPAVPLLRSRLSEFDPRPGWDLAEYALRSLGRQADSAAGRSRDFEQAVGGLEAGSAAVAPAAAIKAWYRAVYYSGLYYQANFAVAWRASDADAAELAAELEPAAGAAEELRRWLEVRGRVLGGSRDMSPVAALLDSAQLLGAAPLCELAGLIARNLSTIDPLRRRPIPALFARLDTRPAHRLLAVKVASRNLNHPGLYQQLIRAAAEVAPHLSEESPARAAEHAEDVARLREIADDPAMPLFGRVTALNGLANLSRENDDFIRRGYATLAADPDGSSQWLVDFLERRGDLAGAVAAVDAALARADHGLPAAYLRSEKARMQLLMGQPEPAVKTIEPALQTGKEDVLLQKAAIELARRQPREALRWARAAQERYAQDCSESAGLVARARWQMGDGAGGAKELAGDPCGILGEWNGTLAHAFTETFAKAEEKDLRQAFEELKAAGIRHRVLSRVALHVARKRNLEIGLDLLAGLDDPAPEWNNQFKIDAYDLILKHKGPEEARAWLRRAMPPDTHNFALPLYQDRRYEMLLNLFPNGEEGESANIVRLAKAAALLHLGETSGPRRDGLAAEVAKQPDEFFKRATLWLLDPGAGVATVASLGSDDLATIGWLMGVKSGSRGDFRQADGWFQVSLESALETQPPLAWSWVIESDWLFSERSLETLEKRGSFGKPQEMVPPEEGG